MAHRAWKLPRQVATPRVPVVHIRERAANEYAIVIEGREMEIAGTKRQMDHVVDWLSMNWWELRRNILNGPDPDWLDKVMRVRPVKVGGQGEDSE
jgi:hypothetical protein